MPWWHTNKKQVFWQKSHWASDKSYCLGVQGRTLLTWLETILALGQTQLSHEWGGWVLNNAGKINHYAEVWRHLSMDYESNGEQWEASPGKEGEWKKSPNTCWHWISHMGIERNQRWNIVLAFKEFIGWDTVTWIHQHSRLSTQDKIMRQKHMH